MTTEQQRDLESVSAHEAAHWVAASFYALNPNCFISGLNHGVCTYENEPTLRQLAIICWSGIMGETLLGTVRAGRKLPPLTPQSWPCEIREWTEAVRADETRMSSTDSAGIRLAPTDSAEAAFQILAVLHPHNLKAKAAQLVEEFRERVTAAIVRGSAKADLADLNEFSRLCRPGIPPGHFADFLRRLPEPPEPKNGRVVHALFGLPIKPIRQPGFVHGTKPR
jgi:hypothetical protein